MKPKVLVVEDEKMVRKLIARELRDDFEVLEASTLGRAIHERFDLSCRLVFVCAGCEVTSEVPRGEVLSTLAAHARACADREYAVRPLRAASPGPGRPR